MKKNNNINITNKPQIPNKEQIVNQNKASIKVSQVNQIGNNQTNNTILKNNFLVGVNQQNNTVNQQNQNQLYAQPSKGLNNTIKKPIGNNGSNTTKNNQGNHFMTLQKQYK